MPTLHIIVEDASNPIRLLKAVRAARRMIGDEAGAKLEMAQRSLEQITEDGAIYVGEDDDPKLIREAADEIEYIIEDAGEAVIDLAAAPKEAPVEIHETLLETTEDGYRLAIQLMSMTNGEPLKALVAAHNLGRMMNDKKYVEAIVSLITVFPVLTAVVEEHGLV